MGSSGQRVSLNEAQPLILLCTCTSAGFWMPGLLAPELCLSYIAAYERTRPGPGFN